jgi:hypothetical protein
LRLALWTGKHGVHLAIGLAAISALFVNQYVVPKLSAHLSFKPLFESFARVSGPADVFAKYRVEGHGAEFYGRGSMRDLRTQDELVSLFQNSAQRAFVIVKRDDLAALDAAFKGKQVDYVVADASSSRFLLLANALPMGRQDENPLRRNVWMAPQPPVVKNDADAGTTDFIWPEAKPPWSWPVTVDATFGGAIELVGADFPSSVRRPGKLPLTLYFRVNRRPPPGYKLFVHLDIPGQPRIIGDHELLDGAFPTSYWLPGEYIRDHHEIDVPLMTTQAGAYSLFVGFWPGGNGTRLPVTQGSNDGTDRVPLGTVHIR